MNLVIYDNQKDEVVELLVFNTYSDEMRLTR